jgi:hypothetical protein
VTKDDDNDITAASTKATVPTTETKQTNKIGLTNRDGNNNTIETTQSSTNNNKSYHSALYFINSNIVMLSIILYIDAYYYYNHPQTDIMDSKNNNGQDILLTKKLKSTSITILISQTSKSTICGMGQTSLKELEKGCFNRMTEEVTTKVQRHLQAVALSTNNEISNNI